MVLDPGRGCLGFRVFFATFNLRAFEGSVLGDILDFRTLGICRSIALGGCWALGIFGYPNVSGLVCWFWVLGYRISGFRAFQVCKGIAGKGCWEVSEGVFERRGNFDIGYWFEEAWGHLRNFWISESVGR